MKKKKKLLLAQNEALKDEVTLLKDQLGETLEELREELRVQRIFRVDAERALKTAQLHAKRLVAQRDEAAAAYVELHDQHEELKDQLAAQRARLAERARAQLQSESQLGETLLELTNTKRLLVQSEEARAEAINKGARAERGAGRLVGAALVVWTVGALAWLAAVAQ